MKRFLFLAVLLVCSSCAKRAPTPPTKYYGTYTHQTEEPKKITPSKATAKKLFIPTDHSKIVIAIDAGHGGPDDKGAKLIIPPHTCEKTLTLQTAKKVQEHLNKWGYKTFMTRTRDVAISLPRRVEVAEEHAATIFVSIHYNSTPAKTAAAGVEIYICDKEKDPRAIASKSLAESIMKRMQPVSGVPSRGVRPGNLAVTRETKIPAVLIETAFLSNPDEAAKLKNPKQISLFGWAIAKGIQDYLESQK